MIAIRLTKLNVMILYGDVFITLLEIDKVISSLNEQERVAKHIPILRISIDDQYNFWTKQNLNSAYDSRNK